MYVGDVIKTGLDNDEQVETVVLMSIIEGKYLKKRGNTIFCSLNNLIY